MTTEERGGGEEDYKEQNDEVANLSSLKMLEREKERDGEREGRRELWLNGNKSKW